MATARVVAEAVRSGFVEGRHHGSVVALAPDGSVEWSVGDVDSPVLPRSCNKPLQAVAMVEAGLDLPPDLLAMACASHSGEAMHLEAVGRILAGVGLSEADLRCPVDWPMIDAVRDEALRTGASASRLFMNCSGKHAAMLATCVTHGVGHRDVPLPQSPAAAGDPGDLLPADRGAGRHRRGGRVRGAAAVGVADGAGARIRTLAVASSGAEARVAEAIRAHPELVSGSTRDELSLLQAVPGAIGKAGAEACYAVALPDGRAFALKVEDGGARARPIVMAAALERSGVLAMAGVDAAGVRRTGMHELLGGGVPVGEVRATIDQ